MSKISNNIPDLETNDSTVNMAVSDADPSFLVSRYKEKLSHSMKVLLMFNKELSYVKKRNEEIEIENIRQRLHIQQLEKRLAEHIAEFHKDDEIDAYIEKVDNLCNNSLNRDQQDPIPYLSSDNEVANDYCHNSNAFQNKISSYPPAKQRKARKTFINRKVVHTEKPLSNQQNHKGDIEDIQLLSESVFQEIKSETESPPKFNPTEASAQCTNIKTELSESPMNTIILKKEKELEFHKLAGVRIPIKNFENNFIDNNNPSLSRNSLTESPVTYVENGIPKKMDISTNCGDFLHREESIPTKKKASYVKNTLEEGTKDFQDVVSSVSSVQTQQKEAQCISVNGKCSISDDDTEAVTDKNENSESDSSCNFQKKQKRLRKKKKSFTAQTSKIYRSSHKQISPQFDLLNKKSDKKSIIDSGTLSIKQSFSESDFSTETAMTENEMDENSENGACAKYREKQKNIKVLCESILSFNNEHFKSNDERPFKSKMVGPEKGSSSETSVSVFNQSEYVKNSRRKNRKRKLKRFQAKGSSNDLCNINSVGSPKPSHVEESDSSIQKPLRKRVKTLDSETSDDIPFLEHEGTVQGEIRDDISLKQDFSIKVNTNQDSDTESNRSFVPERKLRNHKKGGINVNQDLNTESSRNIGFERKLKSYKKGGENTNQDADIKSKRKIVPERNLRSCIKRETNVKQLSKAENNRSKRNEKLEGNVNQDSDTGSIISERKLRSNKKRDSSICPSNCIVSQSQKNPCCSEKIGLTVTRSLRKRMQNIKQSSSNSSASKRIMQKGSNCQEKSSENNKLIKKCSSKLKKNKMPSKEDIVSSDSIKTPLPLSHGTSTKNHIISKEEMDASSQITDHQKKQFSKNSFKDKIEQINVSAEENKVEDQINSKLENTSSQITYHEEEQFSKNSLEDKIGQINVSAENNKLVEDQINSKLENTITSVVRENKNLEEESLSKYNKNTNQELANENQHSKKNNLAEMEGQIAVKPILITSSSIEQISGIFSTKQEFSIERAVITREKTPDLNQTSTKCLISLEETKIANNGNISENIKETSENCLHKLQQYVSLKSTNISSICREKISVNDKNLVEEDFKNILPKKCFVLLEKINIPAEFENRESVNVNHLNITLSEGPASSIEEKTEISGPDPLVAIEETEHKAKKEKHIMSQLKDSTNPLKENCEGDFSFDSDSTPDINSDFISEESIYDDSDGDPDWILNDSIQDPCKSSEKRNKERISLHEDSSNDKIPVRENKTLNVAKKIKHLSLNQKILKVKFDVPKKKPRNGIITKKESSLENHINSAIKQDLTKKNETIRKWEKLFWGTDSSSGSCLESALDENNEKYLTKDADLNNCTETMTEDQVSSLKMKDESFAVTAIKNDQLLKNRESDCSLKNIEKTAVKKGKNNMQKKSRIEIDDNDFDFDADLIIDEINCETLVLPKNLVRKKSHKKVLSVEDRIFGSDSSLSNEENIMPKEQKNNDIDSSNCHHKVVSENNNDNDSDFDPELIDEIICEELQLPEHLIKNDLQKDIPVENKIVTSDNGIKNSGESKNVTFEKNSPISNNKTIHQNNKNHCGDSDIIPELTVCEKNYEEMQLPENLIENNPKKTLPIEDKIFAFTCCRSKNVTTEESKEVAGKSSIHQDKTVWKINKFYNNSNDSDITSESIKNGQNLKELQLVENDQEKCTAVEDEVSGSISILENNITAEKYRRVTIGEGNSNTDEKIVHRINKNCIDNCNSDIGSKLIVNEPDCKKLLLHENDHQKNISVTDKMLKCTKENKMSSQEDAAFYETRSHLLEMQLADSKIRNIENVIQESCENASIISEKEEFSVKIGIEEQNENIPDSKIKLITNEVDNEELMQDYIESNLMDSLPLDIKDYNIGNKNIFEELVSVSKSKLKMTDKQKSGNEQNMENAISEKNTFLASEKKLLTDNDMFVKSKDIYCSDIGNNSDYAPELVTESIRGNNYENLDEGNSNTPQEKEMLAHSDMTTKNMENYYQETSNHSYHASELITESVKANYDNLNKVVSNSYDSSQVHTCENENSQEEFLQTNLDYSKKPTLKLLQSNSDNDTNPDISSTAVSLLKSSESGIRKNIKRHSESFGGQRYSQKYFKHKKLVKRKTCNEYLKYKNVKINPENPIKSILQGIEVKENFYTNLKPHTSLFVANVRFTHCVKLVVNYLMHPDKTPNMESLIFHVIKYLHHTRENPLGKVSENQECIFLSTAENCIVTALFEIEQKSNPRFEGLLATILNAMHQFILVKNKMHIYGLASLCQVLTEICKRRDDKVKPLYLCCDLLKEKHKFASLLIVSIAKVWKELFWISNNLSEEENALQISIAYGITKSVKSSAIVSMYCSLEVVSEYFDVSRNVSDVNKVIEVLKNQILKKSTENSLKDSWKLTSAFVIFASLETWESTKKYLIDDYIIPNLQQFSHHVTNEEAFDLFCNLYVDVFLLFPEHSPDELLMKFFHSNSSSEGDSYIQECAAVALIRHFILSKRDMPLFLTAWQEKNPTKPKVKALKSLFQRRLMSENATGFSKDEIIIT
ncbi:uncharacterized protein LOC129968679 [Argiope bruennichi]|uniref:uncharacterized protein LOC129968679 n=1 Tax=Argiope bruennichi TaxID=94029 RepID=UPI002494280F|nr:uncharacterized protein LOC129968679 [Argiope bruennichi]